MSSVNIKSNDKIQYKQNESHFKSSSNAKIGSEEDQLDQHRSHKQINNLSNKLENFNSSNKKLSMIPKTEMSNKTQKVHQTNKNEAQRIKNELLYLKSRKFKRNINDRKLGQTKYIRQIKQDRSFKIENGFNEIKANCIFIKQGEQRRFSNWLSMKYKQCCKKKPKPKKNVNSNSGQKSNFLEPNKRKSGSKNAKQSETERSQSSGGEDGGSTKSYSKKDSVVQSRQSVFSSASSDQQKIDQEIQMLRDAVKVMSKDKMMEKAYRHLMDGLLYRSVRHDLDGDTTMTKFILFIWKIQNSSLWNDFLLFLGWIYILMSFFEPSNRKDSSLEHDFFVGMVILEIFILSLQTIDLMMEAIQRSTQEGQNIFKSIISHKKNFFRLLFFSLNASDLIYYATQYPVNTFRFARIFRPLQIIIFSKSLRRNFQGIINSAKNLLMILFFDIIITFFWAYIGVNIIGDAYSDSAVGSKQQIILNNLNKILHFLFKILIWIKNIFYLNPINFRKQFNRQIICKQKQNIEDIFKKNINHISILKLAFAVDFRDFLKAANVLYVFSSLDVYPDILFPAITSSFYYILYFLPYLVMFLLLFAPIPVAVVYEGFRKHRLNLLIADRIKRRKALWATFQCIVSDTKRSYIARPDFVSFFAFVYKKIELDEPAELLADVLWNELDANDNKKVSIEEFFTVIDFTEQRKEFRLQRVKPFKKWIEFREYMQIKFNLQGVLESSWFEVLSFFVTIGSCTITILELFLDEQSDSVIIADYIDKGFFGFFVLEILIKIVAYGPVNFLDESWNVFDLILVLFQAFFDFIFYSFMKGSSVKSLSASRVLKIAKLQKVFRMFRAFRTVKVLNYILKGLDIIQKVYEMLYKIVICIPIVMKLSVICVIVFYIYAAIGVEIFSTQLRQTFRSEYGQQMCDQTLIKTTDFESCAYANFNTFGGAVLVLLQVCVGSGWGNVLFDYGKKFNDLGISALYFNSFHFLSVFVLSLIGGLVWEVFDVVERIMRDQQAYEQQLEIQRQWEEQQQIIEASFQSADNGKKLSTSSPSANMRRGSVRQSIKAVSAFMKLPMIAQKMSMKRNQSLEEEDEQFQGGDYPQQFLEDRQISKQQSNKQMNDDQNNLDSYDSDDDSSDSSDSEDNSSNDDEKDGDDLNKDENYQDNQIAEVDEESQLEQETNNQDQSCQNQNQQDQPDKLNQNNGLSQENTYYSNQQKVSKYESTSNINGQASQSGQFSLICDSKQDNIDKKSFTLQFKGQITQKDSKESPSNKETISIKKATSFKEISSQNKGFIQNNIIQTNDKSNDQKGGSLHDSVRKLKKLKRFNKTQTKKRKNNEYDEIFKQSCMIDNEMITQKDRSQIILFQDVFKLSTLDQFFKNSSYKPFAINEQQNDGLIPNVKERNFHIIQEEEEEEYDLNNGERKNINFRKQPENNKNTNNNMISMQKDNQSKDQIISYHQSDFNKLNLKYAKSNKDETQPLNLNKNKILQEDINQQFQDKNNKIMETKKIQGNNNTIPELCSEIKEEDFEEDLKGSEIDIKSKNKIQQNQQETLIELQGTFIDLQEEISIQRIRNTPTMNQNIIRQVSNPILSQQPLEMQVSQENYQRLISKDSDDNQNLLQLFKQSTSDNTQKSQDNDTSYKSFRESMQSNFQKQMKQQEQTSKNDQVLGNKKNDALNIPKKENIKSSYSDSFQNQINQFPQKVIKQPSNNKLPLSNMQSLSRFSSFGGLVYVEESQNVISQDENISSSSSKNSSVSSPSIMKKNKQTKTDSLQNGNKIINVVEFIEQEDSPSGRNQFPQNNYFPSKKIRQEQEYLTDHSSQDDNNSPHFDDTYKISRSSQKIQSDKKSQFCKIDGFNQKASAKQITSAPQLNYQYEKGIFNINKQTEKQILKQKGIEQYTKSINKNQKQSENQIFLADNQIKQKKNISQFVSHLQSDNSKVSQKQTQYQQKDKNSQSNIIQQSQDCNNDQLNDNIYNDENEHLRLNTKENDNHTQSSKLLTTGNIEFSECNCINNTLEEQHNNILQHQNLFMDKKQNKDLIYTNFKKEIDDQSNIEGNNFINDIGKEHLEASFIEEMQNMQESVFEDTKQILKKQKKLKKHQERQQLREKHRLELLKYYKNNLLDIDYQSEFSVQPVVFNAIMKQQKPKIEQINQRDQILDKPKNHQMKNTLLNINQDLRSEQIIQMKIDLNNKNYIINKAILKSVDASKIEKIELRHFRQLYGRQFEDMLDNGIFPLWNMQAKLLFHFDNILKYDYIPIEQFIQLYSSLEMQLSSLLMNKFSSFKIIYQDHEDKWFTINFVQEAYFLQEVEKQGPWTFFDSLFQNNTKNNIFKHRNVFNYQENNEYIKKSLKKFFQNSQDISNSYYFRRLVINQKRSDVVYIPFTNDNPEQTQKSLKEILQRTPNLPEYVKKEDLSLEMIPRIKRGIAMAYLFDNPLTKERKRQFTSDYINIEQAIVEEDILSKEQQNATLNYTYSIELLKDMKNHIQMNKEMLFKKISQFYFYRACFERNFCSITEIPFEQ